MNGSAPCRLPLARSLASLLVLITALGSAPLRGEEKSWRTPPKEPAEALKTFRLHPGFRVELVAAEPLIRDPVAMAFDALGRMYVVEYPEFNKYSFKARPTRSGTVKLLEDSDGDGRFDKASLFLSEVAFPTAIACYDGGVFVGAAPDLLYCKDTDGDGRADRRQKVLTGFARDFAGGGLLNSFRWGLDNRIHIATSFAGGDVRRADRPADEAKSVRSRGVVLNPRTREFTLTSGGGQHGMGVSDWGRKFLCSNVNPMQLLMYDGRYVARNPFFAPPAAAVNINGEGRLAKLHRISPLERWRVERARQVAEAQPDDEGGQAGGLFTSSSGVTIYRGDAWPEAFRGNLFVGEVANNLVYRGLLEPAGLGLVARRADRGAEFLASTDIWFRPVQLANGPDGNLYVVDMYRELIEGAAFVPKRVLDKLDAGSGLDRGRIYRIVRTSRKNAGKTGARSVALKGKTTEELVALLADQNGWHRDTAARLLYERQDPRAAAALRDLASQSPSPLARVHAIYALDGLRRLTAEALLPRLEDANAQVRIHALKLSESLLNDAPELRDKLFSMVNDGEPRVRYQLAFTLGAIPSGESRNRALAQLAARSGGEKWLQTAVQSSLADGADDVLWRLAKRPEYRRTDVGKKMIESLAGQIGAANRSSELARLLKCLELIPPEESAVVQAITRGLLRQANDRVKRRFLAASSGQLKELLSDLVRQALKTAASADAPTPERAEAIRTLALADFRDAGVRDLFARLIQLRQPTSLQSAALQTLARFDHPEVPRLVHQRWATLSPSLRMQAIETMFARSDWTLATLQAVVERRIAFADIGRSRLALLRNHEDPRVQKLARRLLTTPSPRRSQVVDAYRSSLKMKGDADRGRELFKRTCSACHRVAGVGRSVGADLTGIDRRPPETILANILDPNREVKPRFVNYLLATRDGRVLAGMIVEETANGIRLQRADGTTVNVLRVHIKSLRNTGLSFMPEGLEKQLNAQAMADLLAFLTSTRDEAPLKPHPDAIPNAHAPGEVDRPQLVPFIVKRIRQLPGVVVDETEAVLVGKWQYSTHTPPYVGLGYLHDRKAGKGKSSVTFTPNLPKPGLYEVRMAHCYNVRRSTNTPVTIHSADGETVVRVNQQRVPEHDRLFRSLGKFRFKAGRQGWVRISTEGTEGKYVIADAVQFLPVKRSEE